VLSSSEALAFYVHVPALAFYEYVFISCRILTVVVDTAPDAATYSEAFALQVHVFGSCTLTTCVADAWLAQLLHCCQAAAAAAAAWTAAAAAGPAAARGRQQRRQRRRQEEQICVTGSLHDIKLAKLYSVAQ
jgi:hypothetical protein